MPAMAKGTPKGGKRSLHLDDVSQTTWRFYQACVLLLLVMGIGTTGYHVIGGGIWTWEDCLYMVLITISTVGYGEMLHDLEHVDWGREWTIGLIFLGTGTMLYFVSMLTAMVVEGDLRGVLEMRRMQSRIDKLDHHIILCGAGTTGEHVLRELMATQTPFVVVERDHERIEELYEEYGETLLFVEGDATNDDVLLHAGVERASGVVAALHEDRDNVFLTVTARQMNDQIRIVAKAVEMEAESKLRRAGADAVVAPNYIGGIRIASEMVRPSVVQFLDVMMRDPEQKVRIESVTVQPGSAIAGKTLRDSGIRQQTALLIIAVRERGGKYVYNPRAEKQVQVGDTLVAMGESPDLLKLEQLAATP